MSTGEYDQFLDQMVLLVRRFWLPLLIAGVFHFIVLYHW
jgi:hypothetical protein